MGAASSQTRLRIKHLLKYLRSYSPEGKETDEEWSGRESMAATVGDIITIFKPTNRLANASDVFELEVDGICLVFGEDADLPMNYYITDSSYEMSFLEGTLSQKANEAKEKGLSLYCLRSSLLASVGMQTKLKLGQMRKLGGSGERKSPSGGLVEPLCQFFSALAIKYDASLEAEPLSALNLAVALWGDENQKSELKGPELDASFMAVEDENGGLDIDLSSALNETDKNSISPSAIGNGANGSSASDGAAKMAAAEKDASEVWDMLGTAPKRPAEMKEESDLKSLFKKHSTGETKKMSSADALFGSSNDEIFASDDFFSAKSVDEMFGSSAITKGEGKESKATAAGDASNKKVEDETPSGAESELKGKTEELTPVESKVKVEAPAKTAFDDLFDVDSEVPSAAARAEEEAKNAELAVANAEAQDKNSAEKAEQEAKLKLEQEAKAAAEKLEEEARKAENEVKSKSSKADAKARADEEAQAAELAMYKVQAEAKAAAAKAELDAKTKAEEESKSAEAKLEEDAKAEATKAQDEAKTAAANAEEEAKKSAVTKAQNEARAAAERLVEEAKISAEAEEEGKAKAEEAKAKAEEEAKAKAEEEAKAKSEEEAKAKAADEAKAKAEDEAEVVKAEEAQTMDAEPKIVSEFSNAEAVSAELPSADAKVDATDTADESSATDNSDLKDKLRAQAKGNEDVLNRKDLPTRQKIELLLAKQKAAAAAKAKAKAEEAAAESARAELKTSEEATTRSNEDKAVVAESKPESADSDDVEESEQSAADSTSRPQKKLSLQATLTKLEEQSQKAHQKIDEFKKAHELACREDLHLIESKSASFESDFKERLNAVRKEIVVKMRKLSVQATDKLSEIIDEGKVRIEERGPRSMQQLESVGKAVDLSSVDKELDSAFSKFGSYSQERLSVLNLFAEGKDPLDAIVEEEVARIREWRATELQDYIQLFEKVSGRFESRVQIILSEIDGVAKSILDEIERLRDFDTRRYEAVARELSESIANARRFGEMHARAAADNALSRKVFPSLALIKESLSRNVNELRGDLVKKLDEHANGSVKEFEKILDATKECLNKTAGELSNLKKTSLEKETQVVDERLSSLQTHLSSLKDELRKAAESAASGNTDKENSFEAQAEEIGKNCSRDVADSFDRLKSDLADERKASVLALKGSAEIKQSELTQRVKELFEKRRAARQDALKKLDERLDQLAESVDAISSQLIQ